MNTLFKRIAVLVAVVWTICGTTYAQEVRLLTVGNSFADDATAFLPDMAKAGGKQLVLFRANLGGHSLEQHASYLQAFETNPEDPKGRAYKGRVNPLTGEKKNFSLKEALAITPWNFVTIQQVSIKSFKPETYEPYAGILVDYIRKNAPTAEILVHETWAYREDSILFKKGDFTQQKMYEALKAAYEKVATTYKLRILPSGDAFQLARATKRWTFVYPDPKFDYVKPVVGTLPEEPGSLNKGWRWTVNDKTKANDFWLDSNHANTHGRYLGAAVWYEVIFNEDSNKTASFVPKDISPEDAADLRRIAHEAVQARATAKVE